MWDTSSLLNSELVKIDSIIHFLWISSAFIAFYKIFLSAVLVLFLLFYMHIPFCSGRHVSDDDFIIVMRKTATLKLRKYQEMTALSVIGFIKCVLASS